jgi:two-component system, OmpR family, response regulator
MKLLCIEDNVELIESLHHFLTAGSNVDSAHNGRNGLALAHTNKYDAIILDLGLPDISGLDVCLELRRANIQTPILILSGTKDANTKVTLFEAGADDFLTKPFAIAELRARLFALLKRANFAPSPGTTQLLKVGNLTLDPLSQRVERSGKSIKLRRKEFEILEYLMRNRNSIVTRSMIMDNVWDSGSSSWNSTINVHIKRVRDKVDRPYKRKLIKTAYGLGYTINDRG